MARPRGSGRDFGGSLNAANRNLQGFNRNVRRSANVAGDSWRVQQRLNQEKQKESNISSLVRYRVDTSLLSGFLTGAETIGAGAQGAVLRGGGDTAGGTISSDAVRSAAMNALAEAPVFGTLFGEVVAPIQRATEDVGGTTMRIARAGGEVSDELRQTLFDISLAREKRAEQEKRQVAILAESKEVQAQALEGTRLGRLVDEGIPLWQSMEQSLQTAVEYWTNRAR